MITNPMGQHAIACGLDAPLTVEIDGHVGFYCGGMNKQAEIVVHGHAGVGVAENMMSGIGADQRQRLGIGGRHRQWRPPGHRRRCVVALRHLDEGHRHRGRRRRSGTCRRSWRSAATWWCCGDAGEAFGDSIYEARLYVRGKVASLGADCIEKEMRDEHLDELGQAARPGRDQGRAPATSGATARRASSTISTSITPTPTEPDMDADIPRTMPRKIGYLRRSTRCRKSAAPRPPASMTSAAPAPSASCRISTISCSSAPPSRAIRSKATARNAAPMSCSARASRRSRSSSRSRSPSPA